jgi:hypothetical protein
MNIQAIASINNVVSTGGSGKSMTSGSASSSANNITYDKKDLNKDGYVSAEEEFIYDLEHPSEASSQNLLTQYSSTGNLNTTGNETSKLIDIYA